MADQGKNQATVVNENTRETTCREGWLLLTVETVGEWGLKEQKLKGSFLGWFFGLVMPLQEIFVLPLPALVGPV